MSDSDEDDYLTEPPTEKSEKTPAKVKKAEPKTVAKQGKESVDFDNDAKEAVDLEDEKEALLL